MTHCARDRNGLRAASGRSGLAPLDHCLLRRPGGHSGGPGDLSIPSVWDPSQRVSLTHPPRQSIIVVVPPKVVPYLWPKGGPLSVASDSSFSTSR